MELVSKMVPVLTAAFVSKVIAQNLVEKALINLFSAHVVFFVTVDDDFQALHLLSLCEL